MINNRNCEGTEQLQIIFVPEERGEDYENQIVQNSAYIIYTGLLCDACRMWLWKEKDRSGIGAGPMQSKLYLYHDLYMFAQMNHIILYL